MKTHTQFYLLLLILFFISCKKPAGEGGTSTIKGQVWVEDWNNAFTVKNGEYAGADEDVYIIYGDNAGYGDKVKASYDGTFEFRYLRKGKYKIYVYSKDKTLASQSGDTYVLQEIQITKNKQTVETEQFKIYK